MNKLKFLYDVVTTLRSKEVVNGVATVKVEKDQAKIFYVKNQFQKNLLTKQTRANITSEVDYEGKQVKHQSTTEFTNHCLDNGKHHKLFKHMHHGDGQCGGLKTKLTKLAFILSLLDNIKVEQQEDKTILATLELTELPEDIKILLQEKMSHAASSPHQDQCCFMKEFGCLGKGTFSLAMSVSNDYEIDKIVIAFDGVQQHEQHALSVIAELELTK